MATHSVQLPWGGGLNRLFEPCLLEVSRGCGEGRGPWLLKGSGHLSLFSPRSKTLLISATKCPWRPRVS